MLPRFTPSNSARVLVAGDVILDRYIHGVSERISPEAPVPVVKVTGTEERPGGAANVAMNIRSLGVAVQLAAITGADAQGERLRRMLIDAGVQCEFIVEPGVPTITKERVISQHQQLVRLDHESAYSSCAALKQRVAALTAGSSCIVMSDYAKGSLGAVQDMIVEARRHGVPVLVDPKGADFSRYRGASLLTPNMREFEAVVGRCTDDAEMEARARTLCADLGLLGLLVTRGEKGMFLVSGLSPTMRLAARTHEVFDVTGAGDTVIAAVAAALASGYALARAVEYANVAAGMVVEKLGTATVRLEELNNAVAPAQTAAHRVLGNSELAQVLLGARDRGERVVMTNGCFDILHPGHVEYLEQARALGDRLLVAVNSDVSVTRLKGPGRPLTPLGSRMRVLSALACVDWVTAFDEDTPARLIAEVRPDVLVKGGDYTAESVVGADTVRQYVGRVEILAFVPGYSTSAIAESLVARSAE